MSEQRIVVEEDEPDEDVAEAPFAFRHVDIRKDKWFSDEFKIIDFLGRGKFGEVKRCVEQTTGREFAAKFICTLRPQDRKDVEHEVHVMRKLRHRRLVQLYDAFEAKKEMCLVLEIIYGGELFDRVVSDDFVLTERASICLVRQVCEGVEYIHSVNIIHLDLKPENILCLTKSGNRIKIIDFGLAREFDPKGDTRVMFGTPEFMAPEVVQYDPIDFSTDMWSIGVICYVLLSGLSPFMGDTDVETLSNVSKGKFDFGYTEFEKVSPEAKDFISGLLVADKKRRMTARQCLDHTWLQMKASDSSSVEIEKTQLRRFVCRRKWQKAINVLIALKRMGWSLKNPQKNSSGVNCLKPNDRLNKVWNTWNRSIRPETSLKETLKKTPEPQVRTKVVAKVKATDSDSAIIATRTCRNQPSKTDPTTAGGSQSTSSSNSSVTSPVTNSNSTLACEKTDQKKKCRKSVEHHLPGNGHVFNLAKVVSYKPRGIRAEFRPPTEDCEVRISGGGTGSNCVDGLPAQQLRPAIDVADAAKQNAQPNVEGQRPKRNLMIREKIRFFNQIDDNQIPCNKNPMPCKDKKA